MTLIDNRMQTETSSSIKSHLKIAAKVLEQGVTGKLPMRFAFSVYGSLLYCNGCINSANLFFMGGTKWYALSAGKSMYLRITGAIVKNMRRNQSAGSHDGVRSLVRYRKREK